MYFANFMTRNHIGVLIFVSCLESNPQHGPQLQQKQKVNQASCLWKCRNICWSFSYQAHTVTRLVGSVWICLLNSRCTAVTYSLLANCKDTTSFPLEYPFSNLVTSSGSDAQQHWFKKKSLRILYRLLHVCISKVSFEMYSSFVSDPRLGL